ncbi:MAG: hypothetical protein ACTSXG_01655, partial [Alphaproteobacteria bacterium]
NEKINEDYLIKSLDALASNQIPDVFDIFNKVKNLTKLQKKFISFVKGEHWYRKEVTTKDYTEDIPFYKLQDKIAECREQQNWLALEDILCNIALNNYPKSPLIQKCIIENQIELVNSNQIKQIKTYNIKKYLGKEFWRKHEASLFWLHAKQNAIDDKIFLTYCQKAYDQVPNISAFATSLAEFWIKEKNISKAQKILKKTYEKQPHRSIAFLWCSTINETSSADTVRQFIKFVGQQENHPESLWSLALAAFNSGILGQAKSYLKKLLKLGETAEIDLLMSKIEEKESRDYVFWLKRAINAPHKEGWLCAACGHILSEWNALCPCCKSITFPFEWQSFIPIITVNNGNPPLYKSLC